MVCFQHVSHLLVSNNWLFLDSRLTHDGYHQLSHSFSGLVAGSKGQLILTLNLTMFVLAGIMSSWRAFWGCLIPEQYMLTSIVWTQAHYRFQWAHLSLPGSYICASLKHKSTGNNSLATHLEGILLWILLWCIFHMPSVLIFCRASWLRVQYLNIV